MPNELQRVLDAIKADPHGETARNVAHWLAVEVMGWTFDWEHQQKIEVERESYTFTPYTNTGLDYLMLSPIAKGRPYDLDYYYETWQPLTDANHTRMLVRKIMHNPDLNEVYSGSQTFYFAPYSEDPTHDACQVLRKCHADSTLTDEILKGF